MLARVARAGGPPSWADGLAFVVDAGLLAALASLAWKPRGRWPLILAALQGLLVALDVTKAVEPDLRASTFLTATSLTSVAILAVLIHAAWSSRREAGLSS